MASEQFVEVADRVWVARHEWFDLNVTLVGGDRGLLVVDTHASAKAARAVIENVRRLGAGDVVGDRQHPRALRPHLRQRRVPRDVRRGPDPRARGRGREHRLRRRADQERCTLEEPDDPHARRGPRDRDRAGRTTPSPRPSRWTSATARSSWCTRAAATPAGDLVVRVPDVDVVIAGDLVEESAARGHVPGFGARLLPVRVAADPRHRPQPDHAGDRRRPRPRASSTASSSRTSATTSASSPRRSATWPRAAYPSTRRSARADWPFDPRAARARRTPWLRAPAAQPDAGCPCSDGVTGTSLGTVGA